MLSLRYDVDDIGTLRGGRNHYPMYRVIAKRDDGRPKHDVMISGGVHGGEEPSGACAVVEFLDRHAEEYLDTFNFFTYPCINPWGFDHGKAKDFLGTNLNRTFSTPPLSYEASIVQGSLREGPAEYLFCMDMHESGPEEGTSVAMQSTDYPTEFYMWELCDDKERRIGSRIIAALEDQDVPVCKWEKIWGDTNSGGVIFYPEGAGGVDYDNDMPTFESFLKKQYTEQSMTTETYTEWPLEFRVQVQIKALKAALDAYK